MTGGIVEWLLLASVRIALLFACVALVGRLVRTTGVRAEATVWRAGMVMAVALSCLPATLPEIPPLSASLQLEPIGVPIGRDATFTVPPAGGVAVGPGAEADRAGRVGVRRGWSWPTAVVGLWSCGVLIGLTRLLLGAAVLRRRVLCGAPIGDRAWAREVARVRRELPRSCAAVELRCTTWSGAPAVCGLLRSVVLLPAECGGWSLSQRRAVLTHELLHIAHRDPWFTRLGALLGCVFWFHPAVWFATRATARLQELRCDAEVVRAGVDAFDYAELLVAAARRAATRPAPVTLAVPLARRSLLEERVRRILARPDAPPSRAAHAALAALVLWSSLASAAAVRLGHPAEAARCLDLGANLAHLTVQGNANVHVSPTHAAPTLRVLGAGGSIADAWLDRLEVRREGTSGTIVVAGLPPALTLELRLPGNVDLVCTLYGGAFRSEAILRALAVECSAGRIAVASTQPLPGPVRLRCGAGAVEVALPGLHNTLDVGCGSGNATVRLGGAGVANAWISSAAGDVTLQLVDPDAFAYAVECPAGTVALPALAPPSSATVPCYLRADSGHVRVTRV
ncbi:MAG: M56 family metallopeptidase [Planctomycetota bacterium]